MSTENQEWLDNYMEGHNKRWDDYVKTQLENTTTNFRESIKEIRSDFELKIEPEIDLTVSKKVEVEKPWGAWLIGAAIAVSAGLIYVASNKN